MCPTLGREVLTETARALAALTTGPKVSSSPRIARFPDGSRDRYTLGDSPCGMYLYRLPIEPTKEFVVVYPVCLCRFPLPRGEARAGGAGWTLVPDSSFERQRSSPKSFPFGSNAASPRVGWAVGEWRARFESPLSALAARSHWASGFPTVSQQRTPTHTRSSTTADRLVEGPDRGRFHPGIATAWGWAVDDPVDNSHTAGGANGFGEDDSGRPGAALTGGGDREPRRRRRTASTSTRRGSPTSRPMGIGQA